MPGTGSEWVGVCSCKVTKSCEYFGMFSTPSDKEGKRIEPAVHEEILEYGDRVVVASPVVIFIIG